MVSVQLAFRIWIMWCRGLALAPWGAGQGAQLQRTPHRDPWVRGRWEPSRFSRLDRWERGGCFPHQHHTSVCDRKFEKKERKEKEEKKWQWKGRWRVEWWGRVTGVRNIEEEAEATTVIVAELRHCITANHNACSARGKKGWGKNRRRTLGVQCSRFTFQKSLGR